jgi:hypothetical protein
VSSYAGIGSRKTPGDVLQLIELLATHLSLTHTLRSGHAEGADLAFEYAATAGQAEIFLPWPSFGAKDPIMGEVFDRPRPQAFSMAQHLHPAWDACSQAARKLHARNVHQILGYDLEDPVAFVVCWTPDAREVGGTATAIKLARQIGIEVFNLARTDHRERIEAFALQPI